MSEQLPGQMNIFDFIKEEPTKEEPKEIEFAMPKPIEYESPPILTLDNLKPCECGYCGRMAVDYVGCGIPMNGYSNGKPMFENYLWVVFCPECFRVPVDKYIGWVNQKTDKQLEMRLWNENPHEINDNMKPRLIRALGKMEETIELFDGLIKRED